MSGTSIEWTNRTWNPGRRMHAGQPGVRPLLLRARHYPASSQYPVNRRQSR